jgi:hypothetical protein
MCGRTYVRRRRARDVRRAQERAEQQNRLEHAEQQNRVERDLGDLQEQLESSG